MIGARCLFPHHSGGGLRERGLPCLQGGVCYSAPAGVCDMAACPPCPSSLGRVGHLCWAQPSAQQHFLGSRPLPPTPKVMKCDKQRLPTLPCLQVQDEFNGLAMNGGSGTGDSIILREIRLPFIKDIPLLQFPAERSVCS